MGVLQGCCDSSSNYSAESVEGRSLLPVSDFKTEASLATRLKEFPMIMGSASMHIFRIRP